MGKMDLRTLIRYFRYIKLSYCRFIIPRVISVSMRTSLWRRVGVSPTSRRTDPSGKSPGNTQPTGESNTRIRLWRNLWKVRYKFANSLQWLLSLTVHYSNAWRNRCEEIDTLFKANSYGKIPSLFCCSVV